jgi:hypothetical protein
LDTPNKIYFFSCFPTNEFVGGGAIATAIIRPANEFSGGGAFATAIIRPANEFVGGGAIATAIIRPANEFSGGGAFVPDEVKGNTRPNRPDYTYDYILRLQPAGS